MIQSFAVGETTPEEAHKIGMELAGAVLGGKYEFVLTTHVDKDHLHNHLIFNAVSFVDYKKYHSNKQSYHFIRRTSDRICKEHGLSVVVPGQDKGKSYAEYTAEKQGTSYKAKLKTAIDTLIPQVKDFDELLRRLQEMGYEIKQGKYISFRAAGQERFTRTKTLGAAYTEEAIKERIKGVYVAKTKTLREDKKIRLVVDLENSIKAQQSAGYERWAKIHNLKQAAKSMNFLTENKIEYYSELESKIADIMTAHDAAARAVKDVEQRMSDLSLLIKHTTTYRQLKPIYEEYKKSRDKEKYLRGHESEIILFEAAARALKEMQIKKLPDLAALRKEYSSLNDRKSKLYEDYRQAKKQMQEFSVLLVVGCRVCKANQMPDTPRHKVAAALKISAALFIRANNGGNRRPDARFLCNYKFHTSSSSCSVSNSSSSSSSKSRSSRLLLPFAASFLGFIILK